MSTAKDYVEIRRLANGIVISEDGVVFVFSRKLGNWWMAIGRSVKDKHYDLPCKIDFSSAEVSIDG